MLACVPVVPVRDTAASLLQRFEVITLPISRNGKSTKATCKLQHRSTHCVAVGVRGRFVRPFVRSRIREEGQKICRSHMKTGKMGRTRLRAVHKLALNARRYNVAVEYFSWRKSVLHILWTLADIYVRTWARFGSCFSACRRWRFCTRIAVYRCAARGRCQ